MQANALMQIRMVLGLVYLRDPTECNYGKRQTQKRCLWCSVCSFRMHLGESFSWDGPCKKHNYIKSTYWSKKDFHTLRPW